MGDGLIASPALAMRALQVTKDYAGALRRTPEKLDRIEAPCVFEAGATWRYRYALDHRSPDDGAKRLP